MDDHKDWYSRKLPHLDIGGLTQFLTFNLFDSLPQEVLSQWREELKDFKGNIDREREERIQAYLDRGFGSCILREDQCAQIVRDSLLFLDGDAYDLRAWVIMPNHVHFLAHFNQGQSLGKAMWSLKSFTAHKLKKIHPELEFIWHQESYDRYIRNEEHYGNTVRYINQNPVNARLCKDPSSYRWCDLFGHTEE